MAVAFERHPHFVALSVISMSFQALLAPLLTPMLLATAVDERSIGPQSPSKMSPTRTPAMTMDLMSRETRRQYGRVPLALNGRSIKEDQCIFADGKFVLRTDSGYSFLYVPGEGVLVDRSDDVDASEEELWLNGRAYAAVACLKVLYPIHAAPVAVNGRVHAFTRASGSGKCLSQALASEAYRCSATIRCFWISQIQTKLSFCRSTSGSN